MMPIVLIFQSACGRTAGRLFFKNVPRLVGEVGGYEHGDPREAHGDVPAVDDCRPSRKKYGRGGEGLW